MKGGIAIFVWSSEVKGRALLLLSWLLRHATHTIHIILHAKVISILLLLRGHTSVHLHAATVGWHGCSIATLAWHHAALETGCCLIILLCYTHLGLIHHLMLHLHILHLLHILLLWVYYHTCLEHRIWLELWLLWLLLLLVRIDIGARSEGITCSCGLSGWCHLGSVGTVSKRVGLRLLSSSLSKHAVPSPLREEVQGILLRILILLSWL